MSLSRSKVQTLLKAPPQRPPKGLTKHRRPSTLAQHPFPALQPTTKGRPFEILEVEEPDEECFEPPPKGVDGDRPVRSYVNYLLVNGGVILPQLGDEAHDTAAIRIAQRAFGDERRICPVLIEELTLRGGGIHCCAQEIPMLP
ncbi:hypothetical protein MHUMG1_04277 [Metarhizium humberi]|uniref:Uncharacterized protein n=1 Tax=Metarhizium humberi TaxID=2596975 RepID=A0A9P8MCR6_9HYPO|nr:hypothetical protein MHUMG1_04277 [Metarhizium humberi]